MVTPIEPPNRANNRRGDRVSELMLASDCLTPPSTCTRRRWRPRRVAATMPIRASTTAMTTSSLLLLGSANPAPSWPAQAKKTISSTMCTTPPARTLSPMPVTASAGGTPAFCR